MEIFCAVILCLQVLATQTVLGYPYIEYDDGTNKGRVCLSSKPDGGGNMELVTVVAKCCPSSNEIEFKNNRFYQGSSACFYLPYQSSYMRRTNVISDCSTFNFTLNGKMAMNVDPYYYLGDVKGVLKLTLYPKDDRWFLNGTCPALKSASSVSEQYVYIHNKFIVANSHSQPKVGNSGEAVKLYSNGELWLDSTSKCITLDDPPERLNGLENKYLVFNTDCFGTRFVKRPLLNTYELQHTGYCIFKDGNRLALTKCLSATTTTSTTTTTTEAPTTSPTTSSSTTKTTTSASTTSPTTSSSTTKTTTSAPTTSSTTSSSTTKTTTSASTSTTSSPGTTTSTPAPTECTGVCHGLKLANPGQQCDDFCKSLGQFCSTSMQTGNSLSAFTSSGVYCNETTSNKLWEKPYDPSFIVGTSACAGYINVNEIVECIVDGFNDTNIRRLCKCVQSAEEDDFYTWLPWSPCTVSCGGGIQSRSRTCKIDFCDGIYFEEISCNESPCPIDGGFSSWTAWSSCSVTCGGGERSKERVCNNPLPMHGGLDCYGDKRISEICGSNFCPRHGGWTQWTAWSACDKPCNTGMYRRWRYCTNPSPLYDGNWCNGNATEAIPCNTKKCPAENIAVINLRFDSRWKHGMQVPGTQNFTDFYDLLKTNVQMVYDFSDLNSTYQYSLLDNLKQGSVIATFTLYFSGLDSFQILLLQDSIEVGKYLGKLKISGFNNTYNTTIVPASPPLNFTLTALSETSIMAEWKEVPKHLQNGNVSGYILFYREKMLTFDPYKSLATVHLNATVSGLSVFTDYVFRVLAYNQNGNGLACEEQSVYTHESTPSEPPTSLIAKATSGFSITVNWNNIPQIDWNGIPVGAIVKYSDLMGYSGNITVDFPEAFAVINDLVPVTTYVIDVCHTTSVGEGPCQRTQSTTLPSAPSKPPGNVSVESLIGPKTLKITWHNVASLYIHGELKGYKIIYTLIKTGATVVVSTPIVKIIHPSRTQSTLKGLETSSQYSIQVLAYNEIGDGVKSTAVVGETCSCPPVIYTNYAASAPYIYRDKNGKMRGLFTDMLQNLTSYACGGCKNRTSILDFKTNGKIGWAEKKSLTEMKKDIDDYVHLSFPVFGSSELETYNGYAFVSVFSHPGVVYYIIKDTLAKQVAAMIKSVLNTWPIFLVNIVFITLSGFCIWALDSKLNSQEFPRSCLPGVLNGMYWAFITMGTHGYGDLTPKSIAARLFAVVWIIIGLVNFAIFTGALTTAITTSNVYSDPKIYGVEVAAVHDTVAYIAGIRRNAKINTKANYTSVEQVASALKRRDVRGALVDVYSAATRSDLFKHNDIVAKKLLKYPSAFGFVLSGDMKNAAPKFRDYLSLHASSTLERMKNKTAGFEVNEETGKATSMFSADSPVLKNTLLAIGILVIILSILGISYHYGKKYRKRGQTVPEHVKLLQEIEQMCEREIKKFEETVETVLGGQVDEHMNERIQFMKHGKLVDRESKNIFLKKLVNIRKDSTASEDHGKALIIHHRDAQSRATDITEVNSPKTRSKALSLQSISTE